MPHLPQQLHPGDQFVGEEASTMQLEAALPSGGSG